MRFIYYLKKEKVLTIALILAVVSMFLVHPDAGYAEYIDVRVLALLFCLMVIVKGFQDIGLFSALVHVLAERISGVRGLCRVLVFVCFFTGMVITNDVALITFVPFAILTLSHSNLGHLTIRVVVLQTIAANLGSMFTPIGNPQNLFLYTQSGMDTGLFFMLMLPYTLVSFLVLWLCCFSFPKAPIVLSEDAGPKGSDHIDKRYMVFYILLFILTLLVVLRILPYLPVLIVVVIAFIAVKRWGLLLKADFGLLLTFVAFFVFVGNLGRIPLIHHAIEMVIAGREMPISVLFSQFLSNVPAAILLSGFTDNTQALLVGVNIGGLGTIIASMASLISYKFYANSEGASTGRYMLVFTAYNVLGLIILMAFAFFWGSL